MKIQYGTAIKSLVKEDAGFFSVEVEDSLAKAEDSVKRINKGLDRQNNNRTRAIVVKIEEVDADDV